MRRFTGHSNDKWGTFVDVKINASEVLRKELSKNPKIGVALLGSVTDAYQPLERKYKITRSIIEVLSEYRFPFSILTKSDLVLRDLDILKKLDNLDVGLTITTMNDNVRRHFEPHSSSVESRVRALKELHENGISTYVFIGPILPRLTEIRPIVSTVKNFVNSVWAETLNVKCGNWNDIETVLRNHFPHLTSNYKKIVLDQHYWDQVGEELKKTCQEFNIPLTGYYTH